MRNQKNSAIATPHAHGVSWLMMKENSISNSNSALNLTAGNRRDFLKKAMLLAGGAAEAGVVPAAIRQASKIDPAPGTTWKDAEHVVILMQENRSFDHCYGTLRGVRGFEDPRAIRLPNGNPVWLQSNADGDTYAPFRLNIRESKATWMGCLPHGAGDQAAARNGGSHDGWLDAKRSPSGAYAKLPMTMGFYTREDLPFYHALADAFTICDQNFCSSLTGTTPNRLHLWSGTIRPDDDAAKRPCIHNSDADHLTRVGWKTLPERLQENGVSWKVYQNELDINTGLSTEEHEWLSNFGDNPLEYFNQYGVRFTPAHRKYLQGQVEKLEAALLKLNPLEGPPEPKEAAAMAKLSLKLEALHQELEDFSESKFAKLSPALQELHKRAFVINDGDPHFRELESLTYDDQGTARTMNVPKGDVLHQFRKDVDTGALPTVSWMVAPRNFCDHPDAPWYGSWYVAETMDILTRNPEIWKKTIFILCYDENDGQFDHMPPFVPPVMHQPHTGLASEGIDTTLEHIAAGPHLDQPRSTPIGLGYRVPLVVASPWSRGGYVCSEILDHTSIARFVEKFASHKSGRKIKETNISQWRRTICGDLTSVFRPWNGEAMEMLMKVERPAVLASVHQAQFRGLPTGVRKISPEEIQLARENPKAVASLPKQEPGSRPSCALPYELSVHGTLSGDRQTFRLRLAAGTREFGRNSAGAPFQLFVPGGLLVPGSCPEEFALVKPRSYAVRAGDQLSQDWRLGDFENRKYDLRVLGPNGFFREFSGSNEDPALSVRLTRFHEHVAGSRKLAFQFINQDASNSLRVR
ncbi:MAG: phospholipase phosphocholine-specific, partial [Labilithrix sp.]|nr:phospholipase phosphocholine-specific [Labilithrix sp.]